MYLSCMMVEHRIRGYVYILWKRELEPEERQTWTYERHVCSFDLEIRHCQWLRKTFWWITIHWEECYRNWEEGRWKEDISGISGGFIDQLWSSVLIDRPTVEEDETMNLSKKKRWNDEERMSTKWSKICVLRILVYWATGPKYHIY